MKLSNHRASLDVRISFFSQCVLKQVEPVTSRGRGCRINTGKDTGIESLA